MNAWQRLYETYTTPKLREAYAQMLAAYALCVSLDLPAGYRTLALACRYIDAELQHRAVRGY